MAYASHAKRYASPGINQLQKNRYDVFPPFTGGEVLVKLKIAEALQGKQIILLPVSEGGMNLKTTNINQLLEVMGIQKLAGK